MVITRQHIAREEANPSVTKFSKEQNDLKINQVQEFTAKNTVGQYELDLHILGLNYSPTESEMIKGYRYTARRFHLDNNFGFDTTEMMTMINTAKEGLQDQLRKNDALGEEERYQAAEDVISIPSDHNSDSESSGTSSEPASSSSKESTLPAKHTDDNEEIPLKKSHPRPWTSKKIFLHTIKKLYFRCDGSNNIEQLYILPSRWLFLLKFDKIGDAIHELFQNASCTPMQFFVEENLDSWHPKTHGPRN